VVGFGARKIYEDDPLAKYVNTSETPVYHKSQVLYGLDLAKKEIVGNRQVVVVEGYTDVMACHLAGVKTAVATCGTAFGDDHIRKINQLFGSSDQPAEVIFTFDPDAAGQKAAMRAFESSGKFIATTFVAVGPDGLDPCDLRIQKGDDAVKTMVAARKPIYEFAINQKISGHNLDSYPGRLSAATAAVGVLVRVKDLGAREEYVRVLASKVQLGADEINRLLQQELTKQRSQAVQSARRGDFDPVEPNFQDEAPEFPAPNLNDANTRFEQEVLAVLLQIPSAWQDSQVRQICSELFATVTYNVIAQAALQSIASIAERGWIDAIVANSPEPLHPTIRSLAAKPLPIVDAEAAKDYAVGVINRAMKKILERARAALIGALAQTSIEEKPEEHSKLQRDLVSLEEKIRALP
jgi:DNA primase